MEGRQSSQPIRLGAAQRFLFETRGFQMDDDEEDNLEFRLTIPIDDAFAFSMGEFHLGSSDTSDTMRQLVGILIIDALQYGEHWRVAAEARVSLAERWPDCPAFRSSCPG